MLSDCQTVNPAMMLNATVWTVKIIQKIAFHTSRLVQYDARGVGRFGAGFEMFTTVERWFCML